MILRVTLIFSFIMTVFKLELNSNEAIFAYNLQINVASCLDGFFSKTVAILLSFLKLTKNSWIRSKMKFQYKLFLNGLLCMCCFESLTNYCCFVYPQVFRCVRFVWFCTPSILKFLKMFDTKEEPKTVDDPTKLDFQPRLRDWWRWRMLPPWSASIELQHSMTWFRSCLLPWRYFIVFFRIDVVDSERKEFWRLYPKRRPRKAAK